MSKKQIFTLILAFLIGLGLANLVAAQTRIEGPDQTRTGTLSIFEILPGQIADWTITPTAGTRDTFQVDSAGDKLYFASPNAGTYHLACAIVVDGKPQLLTHAFVNQGGEDNNPSPDPTPSPTPEPERPLAAWINAELPKLVESSNLQHEQQLVAQCFRETVQKIDADTIKTAQNARTQLQLGLTMSLALTSETAIEQWQPFLTELSRKMKDELGGKVNDVGAVKTVFEQVAKTLLETETVPENQMTKGTNNADCPTCLPQPTTRRFFQRIR